MSFLGMGTLEILIILLVAFIFLGPERMVDVARTLGKWTGELRRMGSTVQAEMEDLTNVGAPLSSRHNAASNPDDAPAQPLDQDHPIPAERTPRRAAATNPVRAEAVEEQTTPKEERA